MKKVIKYVFGIMLVMLCGLTLLGCSSSEEEETVDPISETGYIKIGYTSSGLKGYDKFTVEKKLKKKGFTNITFNPIQDIIIGLFVSDGEVKSVSIDGSTSYSKEDYFMYDTLIVINYHAKDGDYCTNGLKHTWVTDEAVTPIDCQNPGYTEGSHCSVCGKIKVAQKELPVKHKEVIDAAVPATDCQHPGLSEGSHCSVCGKIIKAQVEVEGTHTPVIDVEATLATDCQHPGHTEGSHCGVCGKVIQESREIEGEHNVVIDSFVAPTSSRDGKTEGSHCSVCGKIIQKQETITWEEYSKDITDFYMNQRVIIKNFEFVMEEAYNTKIVDNYLGDRTENNYVVITMEITNISDKQRSIDNYNMYYYRENSKYENKDDQALLLDNGLYLSEDIGAGITKTVQLVYEIPSSYQTTDYLLINYSGEKKKIYLSW